MSVTKLSCHTSALSLTSFSHSCVADKSMNSWKVERTGVKEGDNVTAVVTSVRGNPPPTHECKLQLHSGSEVSHQFYCLHSLHSLKITRQSLSFQEPMSVSTVNDANSRNSTFTVTADRRHNSVTVMCSVKQGDWNESVQQFSQNVTVYCELSMTVTSSIKKCRHKQTVKLRKL